MMPGHDDDVSMAEVADAGRALDALAAAAGAPDDLTHPALAGRGIPLLLALQAKTLAAEAEREEFRRPVQAASAALDALADGRGHDIPEVAALAALRTAIDRPATVPVVSPRRHARRRRIVATVALAAVFSAGGVTAAAAASQPGDQLYSLRVAVLGRVNSDPVVSRDVLNEASSALAGTGVSTARSERLLAQAANLVPQIKNPTQRKALAARLAALTADLHRRIADRSSAPGAGAVATPEPGTPAQPGPTPSVGATSSPGTTPSPGTHRRGRRHPVRQPRATRPRATPTPKPARSLRPSPRPTPTPSVTSTPTVTPSVSPTAAQPTPTPTPSPRRSRKASPTPSASTGSTSTETPSTTNT